MRLSERDAEWIQASPSGSSSNKAMENYKPVGRELNGSCKKLRAGLSPTLNFLPLSYTAETNYRGRVTSIRFQSRKRAVAQAVAPAASQSESP